jgi:hypothetical protein
MAFANDDLSEEERARFGRMYDDARKGQREAYETWPDPVSLPAGLSPVEPFKPEVLPDSISPWVTDIARRLQCPPDYPAVATMVALGSVLGRRIGVKPQSATDWYEVPNLWGCTVGRPSTMKSPSADEALKPLYRLEVDASKEHEAALKDYGKAQYQWKMRRDVAEAQHKAALKKNPNAELAFDVEEPEEPAQRRYVTNDSSYEKLGELLAQNPNGILSHRDELVSLLKTLDQEQFAAFWYGLTNLSSPGRMLTLTATVPPKTRPGRFLSISAVWTPAISAPKQRRSRRFLVFD